MKSGKYHDQPLDPDFQPILTELVAHRRSQSESRLCNLPLLRGVEMRRFLDSLIPLDSGFAKLSLHGLRATLITRWALSGVPQSMTMRFVQHASAEIHQIYLRLTSADLAPAFERVKLNK
jgi:integrase